MKRKWHSFTTLGAEALVLAVAMSFCGAVGSTDVNLCDRKQHLVAGCSGHTDQQQQPAPAGVAPDAPCDPNRDTGTVDGLNCQSGISAQPGDPGPEWG